MPIEMHIHSIEWLILKVTGNRPARFEWLENALNYANGKLLHVLLLSGQWIQRRDMIDMGLKF